MGLLRFLNIPAYYREFEFSSTCDMILCICVICQHQGGYFTTTALLYCSSLHALIHYSETEHACRTGCRRSAFLVKETSSFVVGILFIHKKQLSDPQRRWRRGISNHSPADRAASGPPANETNTINSPSHKLLPKVLPRSITANLKLLSEHADI